MVDLAQAKEREEFFTEGEGTIVWTRVGCVTGYLVIRVIRIFAITYPFE